MTQTNKEIAIELIQKCRDIYTPEYRASFKMDQKKADKYTQNHAGVYVKPVVTVVTEEDFQDEFIQTHPELSSAIEEVYDFLMKHFPLGDINDEEGIDFVDEINYMFRTFVDASDSIAESKDMSDECFAVYAMMLALKHYSLPMIRSRKWRKFAEQYAGYMLSPAI